MPPSLFPGQNDAEISLFQVLHTAKIYSGMYIRDYHYHIYGNLESIIENNYIQGSMEEMA